MLRGPLVDHRLDERHRSGYRERYGGVRRGELLEQNGVQHGRAPVFGSLSLYDFGRPDRVERISTNLPVAIGLLRDRTQDVLREFPHGRLRDLLLFG